MSRIGNSQNLGNYSAYENPSVVIEPENAEVPPPITQYEISNPTVVNPLYFKPSPSSSNSSCFCRICHEGDNNEPLVAPCKCTGTVALIHTSCLEHWLTTSNSELCEICKFSYKIEKKPQSCTEYFKDSSNAFNIRNLIADIICFFLLTPLLVVSTYLCALGAHEYFRVNRWEAVGLVILSMFLLGVYFTWCHVTLRFHISLWKAWQRTHQQIRLVEIPAPVTPHCRRSFSPPSFSSPNPDFIRASALSNNRQAPLPFTGQYPPRQPQFAVVDEGLGGGCMGDDDADRRILIETR